MRIQPKCKILNVYATEEASCFYLRPTAQSSPKSTVWNAQAKSANVQIWYLINIFEFIMHKNSQVVTICIINPSVSFHNICEFLNRGVRFVMITTPLPTWYISQAYFKIFTQDLKYTKCIPSNPFIWWTWLHFLNSHYDEIKWFC